MRQQLWAPWRMEFIERERPSGCFFCAAASVPADREAEHLVLWRTERALALMNRYPYNNGHLMVAPHAHLADLEDLDEATSGELMALTQRSLRALRHALRPEGFNVGVNLGRVAGAGVTDHVHQHVVPRWNGDTNFMPVLGEVKVMSEHLRVTYAKIRAAFEALGS
ncbi:MAG TPA: HIT domain-containing protein [Candidatus Limnocylindrales bacterium]|nr:HIT domain-containing protein [Candidatus Limnocylindrales bacterium]